MPRVWRTPASIETERRTRDALPDYLRTCGYTVERDVRHRRGTSISQYVHCATRTGERRCFWVRLCWRRDRHSGALHSAAQLLSNVANGAWIEALAERMRRAAADGATHLLLVQNRGSDIAEAVSIPIGEVVNVWSEQRAASRRLIESGAIRGKNHAENGRSPTIWLRDSGAASVEDALWQHPGVESLESSAVEADTDHVTPPPTDDVFLDLPTPEFGRDRGERTIWEVAGYPRDPRVRRAVLLQSGRRCERPGCVSTQSYRGFLDVHHILGIAESDRLENCVALCPNCHRDAHFHPDREELNKRLLKIARKRARRTAA
jgi:5-methylcytosine-specific restriction protein A